MATNYRSIAVHASEGKVVSLYDSANSEWIDITGVGGVSPSGGGKTGRSVGGDDNKRVGLASLADVPSIDMEITVSPATRAWTLLNASYDGDDLLDFRLTTRTRTLLAETSGSNNVSIASATGIATFTGTQPNVNRLLLGAGIVAGTVANPINSVDENNRVTVNRPATAVTGQNYSVVILA